MLSIVEIVNSVQKIGSGALFIVHSYSLSLIEGNNSIYLLDSLRNDDNDNVSTSSTAVLLKFDTFHLLKNYIG